MKIDTERGWSKQTLIEALDFIQHNCLMGSYLEFGVHEGLSLKLVKDYSKRIGINFTGLYGFDSFQGLPNEDNLVERFYLFNKGFFDRSGVPVNIEGSTIIKAWFSDLTSQTIRDYNIFPAALVHFDCDLYISTKQALEFVFKNKLISAGALLVFDEFKSTNRLEDGGESKAFFEICDKYKVECQELYRNIYIDRIECWQNVFIINNIGRISNYGVYNES